MRHTRKRNRNGGTAYHYMMKRMGFHPTMQFDSRGTCLENENIPKNVSKILLSIQQVARENHFLPAKLKDFFNDVICPNIQILSEIDNQFNTKYPKLYLRWLIGYGQDLVTDTDGNINYKFTAENKKNVDLQHEEGKASPITDKDIQDMFLVYLSQVEDKRNEKAKAIIKAREPGSIQEGGKKHQKRKYKKTRKYNKKRKHRASRSVKK